MNQNTPIIYADGTGFYEQLAKEYAVHPKGLFILAPSASGKTYFVNQQESKEWIDGDYLWQATSADLSDKEWNTDFESVHEINRRSDVMTYQAMKLGFWVMGSSNESLRPDGIVILPWKTHLQYIELREKYLYDGGAKLEDIEDIKVHRKIVEQWKERGVPCFDSIDAAVDHLAHSMEETH